MDEDIKKLLEQNLELTKEVHRMTKKIKNYVNFQKVMSAVYILVIVVPIILGMIFLPPLLKDVYNQYKEILGVGAEVGSVQDLLKGSAGSLNLNNVDINKLSPQIKALLNK